jgi:hypothetical protein
MLKRSTILCSFPCYPVLWGLEPSAPRAMPISILTLYPRQKIPNIGQAQRRILELTKRRNMKLLKGY